MNGLQLLLLWSAFLIGVTIESLFTLDFASIAILLVGTFFSGLLWRVKGDLWFLVISLCCLLLVIGIVRTQQFEAQFVDSPLAAEVGQRVTLTGTVVTEPDERANFTQLFVQTETDRVLVRADRFIVIDYGDVVQITGSLSQPEPFTTDIGRTFDYPKYLEVRKVQYIISFADIAVIDSDQGNVLLAYLYQAKQFFVVTLEDAIGSPQVDLGVGLLLGVKQALGDELEIAFRQTGIIHIVVLSGYNVMLVVGFFWWLSSWVLPLRGRIVFGLIGITLFALLVGLSATVVRASIMAAILLIGKLLGRTHDVLRALLFAALVMVLINPYILLYDIGFQLSFMATLGLVLVLPQFESTVATNTTQLKLKDLLFATIVTQIFVLPLLMYHIGEVSLVSVVVNMLVLPMVPVAMLLTFIAGLVGTLATTLGTLVGFVAYLPLHYIILIAEWFAAFPFAVVTIPEISVWVVAVMYILLGIGYWLWRRYRKTDTTQVVPQQRDVATWEVVEEAKIKTDLESGDSKSVSSPIFFR
jgi:competence protein ComEC